MDRNLQLLGMAKKAGLLAVGGESVSAAARSGKAKAIISACDTSKGSMRRALSNSEDNGVAYIVAPYTKFELGNVTGRGSPGTLAILDAGLAAGFLNGLAEVEPERYGQSAAALTKIAKQINNRNRKIAGKRTAGKGRTAL